MEPKFFAKPADFRKWLKSNHRKLDEQWIGFYKVKSGIPSMTWPQSVDEALCFGWIDGKRMSIDEKSYKIRFTPRRPNSIWSAVNLKRVPELIEMGLMKDAGLEIYNKRKPKNERLYAYEQGTLKLDPNYKKQLKSNKKAWAFFQKLTPSVKKPSIGYVMMAKREETRIKRLGILIQCCEEGKKLPSLRRKGE